MLELALIFFGAFACAAVGFSHAAYGQQFRATFYLGVVATWLILIDKDTDAFYTLATGTILAWTVIFLLNEHYTEQFHEDPVQK